MKTPPERSSEQPLNSRQPLRSQQQQSALATACRTKCCYHNLPFCQKCRAAVRLVSTVLSYSRCATSRSNSAIENSNNITDNIYLDENHTPNDRPLPQLPPNSRSSEDMSSARPSSFPQFGRLPRELRNDVYHLAAAAESREIEVVEVAMPVFANGVFISPSRYDVWGDPRPAIVAATREAEETLVGDGTYKIFFLVEGAAIGVYFNPEVDTVRLKSHFFNLFRPPMQPFVASLANPFEVTTIKTLSVPIYVFEQYQLWIADNITSFRNLRQIFITLRRQFEPLRQHYEGVYFLALHFEPQTPFIPLPNTPNPTGRWLLPRFAENGVDYYGIAAMTKVFQHVRSIGHQQRLMTLWANLDILHQHHVALPHLTLYADYLPAPAPLPIKNLDV
ncbi:hypothetical protein G7Y89_g7125 [Cudoniella acicularis]|uniref:2EXR domain-containing protein n=1 Tax=Cudoniella acicularis TaxID=354080 RepID=A0A8H4RJ66_9HELO|nr:hypothetical protein G7Y89_g7125 [Cudoniella acicularis]